MRYDHRGGIPQPDLDAPGLWRWRALLPKVASHNIVSLHEGNTPLVRMKNWPGPVSLYVKNDTANPTWSYKDRANSVTVSVACDFGFENVVAVSTGNHGSAAAAYCSAADRRCIVFCHEDAPELQVALMRSYGATVFRGGRQVAMASALVARGGWFPAGIICPRGGFGNPFGVEGFKTISFEIFDQLGGTAPDRVFVPVGSGDGLYGIWKGFVELRQAGRTDQVPRMYACQASGANPYVRAYQMGRHRLTAVDTALTVALSIAEKIGGEPALQAVYESGGAAVEADDESILRAAACLARTGLALEPSSAAALACARLVTDLDRAETWVAIGTGAAVKWPEALTLGRPLTEKLPSDFDTVDQLL
jgi:threonine synthase